MSDLNVMYPSMSTAAPTPVTAAAAPPAPVTPTQEGSTPPPVESHQQAQERIATAMYAEPKPAPKVELPPGVAELRADPERAMYPPQTTYREAIPDDVFADAIEYSPEQQAVAVSEWREIAGDLGLERDDARSLLTSAQALTREPPTAETEATWQQEIHETLRRTYFTDTPQQLAQRLADARTLVARDPRVVRLLEETRLGNHPATVLKIIDLARTARAAGKLK